MIDFDKFHRQDENRHFLHGCQSIAVNHPVT